MRKQRSSQRKLLPCLVLGSLAPSMFSAAAENHDGSSASSRQGRLEQSAMASEARKLLGQDALTDMWESAVEASETARLLQDFSMSMPTRSPTRRPSTPPPVAPTAPTPVTRSPTPSPTVFVPTPAPTTPPPTISPAPTSTPSETCLEGTPIEDHLLEVLGEITDSSILLDTSTPQGMAFDFMVNDDPLHPCDSTTIEQRYGLLTLFYATSGSTWTDKSGWLSGQGECEWFGIQCNTDGRVTRVQLGTCEGESTTLTSPRIINPQNFLSFCLPFCTQPSITWTAYSRMNYPPCSKTSS
jgi:hypothetical protein